jgi:superfamily II DNA/RNA helicase
MLRYLFILVIMMQRVLRTVSTKQTSRLVVQHRRSLMAFASQHQSFQRVSDTQRTSASLAFDLSKCSPTRLFSTDDDSSSPAAASSGLVNDFFAPSDVTFASIGVQSPILLERLEQTFGSETRPSAVQAAAYSAILEGGDVTIGAETGSGKTLAYLLPLLDDILKAKQEADTPAYDFCRAIILVPNKELVNQVVRMAMPLCGGPASLVTGSRPMHFDDEGEEEPQAESATDPSTVIRLAVMPGGLNEPQDFQPFRNSIGLGGSELPIDLVVSTPAALGPLGLRPTNIDMFADIDTLVIDEADMLLDGGYIRQLENALLGFKRAGKLDASYGVKRTQHVFVAATLPDMGLRSVDAYLQKRFPYATTVTMAGMHNARHYGLRESTVWIEAEGNKERMERLVELLKISPEEGGLEGEKVMVFLNSVDDVDGANGALERAGFPVVKYHAKISLTERTDNLNRFRKYTADADEQNGNAVPILVCTDLASRGLDVPGVTAVVQLQFAGNVVAHLHRMGRCGRAGQRNGRGIIFYDEKQRELIDVVREAEEQQERMVLMGDVEEVEDKSEGANVKKAFSRKRGFTKKRKKERKEEGSDSVAEAE